MHKIKSDICLHVSPSPSLPPSPPLPPSLLPLIVGSRQRVESSEAWQVDVVLDDHHISHFVVLVEAPGCIGHDHRLHAHHFEDAHGQRDLENTRGYVRSATDPA
ncbi:hypothetical protein INR49_009938 [Caranx melampygus]|nr:hypothetical protein INR49_009938 [Caranx melampygus]